MRRWFIVMMVLLMPIRGIIGDAMAYAMVPAMPTPAIVQPQKIAANVALKAPTADAAPSAMPCHMGKSAKSDTPQAKANAAANACSACQVCHASVLLPFTLVPALLALPSTAPTYTALAWRSAEPRQLAKNPIL
jgi:hypothetical protein